MLPDYPLGAEGKNSVKDCKGRVMGECECIYRDIADLATLHTERVCLSRLERKCGECGGAINLGAEYERVWGIWDGVKFTHFTCSICLVIRNTFFCTWVYGMLWEDLRENFWDNRFIPWSTIGTLPANARGVFCDWVERDLWGDDDFIADMEEEAS